jgi:ABC-type antimicrobial peptide transport system ATPase subunit
MFAHGRQLSIGQWQKIALARAFMRQAPVVILDEPTASIDAAAEAEIFGRLREITRGATALLIAHRFSTIRMADHIIVLAGGGRMVEQGTHEGLVRAGGTYATLFTTQAAGYAGLDSRPWFGSSVPGQRVSGIAPGPVPLSTTRHPETAGPHPAQAAVPLTATVRAPAGREERPSAPRPARRCCEPAGATPTSWSPGTRR